MSSNKETTNEDLARMVANGFDDLTKQINGVREDTGRQFTEVKSELKDIKLRLDNVAYRFELQELDKRVAILERQRRPRQAT